MIDSEEVIESLLSNFPFDELRPQQGSILTELSKNWNDKKYFFIDAPTGVGKSGIALAIAKMTKSAFFLTSTKALQDQYMNDFNLPNIKGRSNYTCNLSPNFRVDVAPCLVKKELKSNCIANSVCSYYTSVYRALGSPAFITSYSYFIRSAEWGVLSNTNPSKSVARDVLIADEAHEMERIITDYISMDISAKKLREYGINIPDDYKFEDINTTDDVDAIESLCEIIEKRYDYLNNELEKAMNNAISWVSQDYKNISKIAAEQIEILKKKVSAVRNIFTCFNFFTNNLHYDWLIVKNKKDNSLKLAPLNAGPAFHVFIKPLAKKFVFMSASLGDKDTVYKELGLNEKECVWISVGTPFDPKKAPIASIGEVSLSKMNFNKNINTAVEVVCSIMETFPDKKGIIHTGNYQVADAILGNSPSHVRRRLIGKSSSRSLISNEEMIFKHSKSNEPTVLISPSMMSGVDLKGDLSTFQIIVKLPWSNLGDAWVKAKSEADGDWYTNDMIRKLVQACGRSIRTEEDEADTFIIDSSFKRIYNSKSAMFPKWFRERVIL